MTLHASTPTTSCKVAKRRRVQGPQVPCTELAARSMATWQIIKQARMQCTQALQCQEDTGALACVWLWRGGAHGWDCTACTQTQGPAPRRRLLPSQRTVALAHTSSSSAEPPTGVWRSHLSVGRGAKSYRLWGLGSLTCSKHGSPLQAKEGNNFNTPHPPH